VRPVAAALTVVIKAGDSADVLDLDWFTFV